jgi:hypothetical protein
MRRELLVPYLLVGGGFSAGLAVGIFVLDARPPVIGWVFGGGVGLMLGAFITAIISGESLVSSRMLPTSEFDSDELDPIDDDAEDLARDEESSTN